MTTATSSFIDLPGRGSGGASLRLHYRDWAGEGAPMLLLHGLASGARIWDMMAPYLTPHFRVIAVDQRGHGLSDKPGAYGFDEVVADVASLIAALGLDRPVIAGHSWGGNVALQLAAEHPELVRSVILVDGGFLEISSFEGMTWERAEVLMRPPAIDGASLDGFVRTVRSFPHFEALWSDQLQEMFLSNFEIKDSKVYRRLPVEDHMKIVRAMWDQKPSLLWARLRCPVLMIPVADRSADARSEMWVEGKRRAIEVAQRELPAARVLWMENSIHDVPIQRPKELAEAIIQFAEAAS